MTILLLGATGRTGQHVIKEAIARGHRIIALGRSSKRVSDGSHIRVVEADPCNSPAIAAVLGEADVVLSCLGQRSSADATLLTDSASAVVKAMRDRRAIPYIVISQGLLFPSKNPFIGLLRLLLRRHVRDSEGMERVLLQSDLQWEIVRPPRLKDSPGRSGYCIAAGSRPAKPAVMERADLARYLVDESERGAHLREVIGITAAAANAGEEYESRGN